MVNQFKGKGSKIPKIIQTIRSRMAPPKGRGSFGPLKVVIARFIN